MELIPIRTKRDYQTALREVSPFFDKEPTPGSAAGNRFEVLIMLIEAYEAKHYAITPPTPIEAIKFRMEQAGLTVKDLEPMIGLSNRIYEVLNGKRSLTLPMIRCLHSMLDIPAESLIA
jgi:HTH-type transcriptional regulator / antitoxin HigA